MKYVSLIMVVIIVGLSWFLLRPKDGLSAEQHARLQQVIAEYLKVYVQEKEPMASNMQEPDVSTRVVEAGRTMVANFKIGYEVPSENGPHRIVRNGTFSLVSDNGQNWTAKMERIDDAAVQFADGDAISISLSDAKAAGQEEAKEAKEHKETEHAEPAPAH